MMSPKMGEKAKTHFRWVFAGLGMKGVALSETSLEDNVSLLSAEAGISEYLRRTRKIFRRL